MQNTAHAVVFEVPEITSVLDYKQLLLLSWKVNAHRIVFLTTIMFCELSVVITTVYYVIYHCLC